MDHDFAEFKFVVAFLALVSLCDGTTLAVIGVETGSAISNVAITILIFIQGRHSRVFANTAIALGARLIVLPTKIEWLKEQEDRDLDKGKQEQNNLDSTLSGVQLLINETRSQEHVDQHVEQTWRRRVGLGPVNRPFVDDTDDQVAEDGLEEDHSRNEVTPDVDRLLEVTSVEPRKAQRVRHVNPTKNDTHLHLVTVAEEEIVLSSMPSPINTKRIAVVALELTGKSLTLFPVLGDIPLPSTVKESQGLGEHIVVDETGVEREDSHDQGDVTTIVDHGEQFESDLLEGLLPVDHGQRGKEHDDSVSEVTKHDSEEEREGNNGRQGRVDLLVCCGTISIDDGLESLGELVCLQVRWRRLVRANLVDDGWNGETGSVGHILESGTDERQVIGRAPAFSNESPARLIKREEVERLVCSLFLGDEDHPGRQRLSNLSQLSLQSVLSVPQHVLEIVQSDVDLVDLITTLVAVLIDLVKLSPHGLGDLANLGENLFAVGKNDKDILVDSLVGRGVDQGLRDLGLVHVQVATQRTPKNTLKGTNAVTRNDTSDEANVHAGKRSVGIGGRAVLLDILQERGVVVLGRVPNLLHIAVSAVKEATSLLENPSPFSQLDFTLLQCFVALVQGSNSRLQALAALSQLINLVRSRGSKAFDIEIELSERDVGLFHLAVEVACQS